LDAKKNKATTKFAIQVNGLLLTSRRNYVGRGECQRPFLLCFYVEVFVYTRLVVYIRRQDFLSSSRELTGANVGLSSSCDTNSFILYLTTVFHSLDKGDKDVLDILSKIKKRVEALEVGVYFGYPRSPLNFLLNLPTILDNIE
jgi:hypothetical protein